MSATVDLKLRIRLGDEIAMGPGKADLLEAIVETGSISGAARRMNMSYRRAWLLVDVMNHSFRESLVLGAVGGRQGGGARVTDTGLQVLAHYRALERSASEAAQRQLDCLIGLLADRDA